MTSPYTIKLFPDKGIWMTEWDDPAVIDLMGSNVIPTPYLDTYPMSRVLEDLRTRNPEYTVRV